MIANCSTRRKWKSERALDPDLDPGAALRDLDIFFTASDERPVVCRRGKAERSAPASQPARPIDHIEHHKLCFGEKIPPERRLPATGRIAEGDAGYAPFLYRNSNRWLIRNIYPIHFEIRPGFVRKCYWNESSQLHRVLNKIRNMWQLLCCLSFIQHPITVHRFTSPSAVGLSICKVAPDIPANRLLESFCL